MCLLTPCSYYLPVFQTLRRRLISILDRSPFLSDCFSKSTWRQPFDQLAFQLRVPVHLTGLAVSQLTRLNAIYARFSRQRVVVNKQVFALGARIGAKIPRFVLGCSEYSLFHDFRAFQLPILPSRGNSKWNGWCTPRHRSEGTRRDETRETDGGGRRINR